MDYKEQFLLRRYLDDFDYVSFLNGDGIHGDKKEVDGWLKRNINLLKERFR